MVDTNIVNIRVSKLYKYLANLEKLKCYPFEEFQNNFMVYSAAERQLHLAIECVQDIASHIVADERLGSPATNKDVYILLHRAGIIPEGLSKKLAEMAKFRNILVHDYIELDKKTVYEIIRTRLGDITDFVKCVLNYCK